MKTKFTLRPTLILLAVSFVLSVTSCKREGCMDSNATNYDDKAKEDDGSCEYEAASTTLSGDISSDLTLDASLEYTLAGGVHVLDGATLTIPAGTVIKSDPNESVAYLLIEQGGMIDAQGTATSPIVFTSGSSSPSAGDWGGIILCGKAPINSGSVATAEVGDVTYGGSLSTDNSGTLRYVRVEYTGNAINDEKEHNGFTFNGVGSATTVEYLQAFMGNDDGFEFFGGSVSADYLVSTGSGDDCFDWTYGWVGSGSYWIAEQADGVGDRGIEADNNGDNNSASPFSNPTLQNITLTGYVGSESDGMKLREGTKGDISNVLISNFQDGVEVEHEVTVKNAGSGDLTLSGISVTGSTGSIYAIKGAANASDSTNAASAIDQAIDGSATGAGTDWINGWTKSL
jgi:trimeric autotransporter adhesin